MPWRIRPAGEGKWYVVDDNGRKYSKKPMSKWRAKKQLAALNASGAKEISLDRMLQNIRTSVQNTLNPNSQIESSGAWVNEVYPTYVVVNYGGSNWRYNYTIDENGQVFLSDPVEVTSEWVPAEKAIFKELTKDGLPASAFLVVEDPEKVTTWHLPVRDASGKPDHRLMGAAWAALHGGYRGQKYQGPGKAEAVSKLKKMYESEDMPVSGKKSFWVLKQADGNYRWFTISSSAFRDRDGEIVTEKALAEDVARCNENKEYGPLRWWHVGGWEAPDGLERWDTWRAAKGLDLGVCDFNLLHGKMLIESGTFSDPEVGEALAEADEDFEISIAFSHPDGEPGEEKEYRNIHRFERSLLPSGMASNVLTKFYMVKEDGMKINEKVAALVAILRGKPELAKQILDDAESVQKAAEAAGLEYKEVSEAISGVLEAEKPEEESPEAEVPEAKAPEVEAPEIPEVPAEKEGEDKQDGGEEETEDVIGDMSHEQLKAFVTDIVKQLIAPKADKGLDAQAKIDQQLADALVSLKGVVDKIDTLESKVNDTNQRLEELADARPLGIKQLMERRSSQSVENVTKEVPVGPHIDDDFKKFARGGK